jgi:hypothetical protein
VDGYLLPDRCLLDQRDRVAGVMIPAAHLDRWAETQADYMAEIRRRAWMREHMPEMIDEGDDW